MKKEETKLTNAAEENNSFYESILMYYDWIKLQKQYAEQSLRKVNMTGGNTAQKVHYESKLQAYEQAYKELRLILMRYNMEVR